MGNGIGRLGVFCLPRSLALSLGQWYDQPHGSANVKQMKFYLLILIVGLMVLPSALAEPVFKTYPNHSQVRLVTSASTLSETHDTWVGLQVRLDPDWHAYWQNPGDSGAAPILKLVFDPDVVSVSEIQWPTPERIATPPLMTFGYEREVLWWAKVRLRAPPPNNQPIRLTLEAEWLVCKVECIPAFDSFTHSFTPGKGVPTSGPEAALFTAYQARLPQSGTLSARYTLAGSTAQLTLAGLPEGAYPTDFFPLNNDHFTNAAPTVVGQTLHLPMQAAVGDSPALAGVVRYAGRVSGAAYVQAQPVPPALWPFLLMAFAGGVILNLMPCVFPMIAIKLLALLRHGGDNPRAVQVQSLAYIAGVQVTFLGFALGLAALRAAGQALGWGFQLQSPPVLVALVVLFFVLGLNFLGLYEFRWPWAVQTGPARSPLLTQFSGGMLAVIVASPCTAPFMGAAMGFALGQSIPVILATFFCLGLGFSLPYLLLLGVPQLVQHLPKPGAWMVLLKELMAFPMFLTALWLLWVLARLQGPDGPMALVASLILLAIPFWWAHRRPQGRTRWAVWALMLPLAGALAAYPLLQSPPPAAQGEADAQSFWQPFRQAELATLTAEQPVFINFTAAWCITCQVNEQLTFRHPEVRAAVAQYQVQMRKADWTARDPEITAVLAQFNRISVPFYLLYVPGQSQPVILPELLRPEDFLQTLKNHLVKT